MRPQNKSGRVNGLPYAALRWGIVQDLLRQGIRSHWRN